MPLVWKHELVKTNDCNVFTIRNTTVYGAPNQDRNQAAEVLIVAHVTEKGVEEFLTLDSTPYLTKTEYSVTNSVDGHYRIEFLRFQLWSGTTSYVKEVRDGNNIITTYASVVYNPTTGKFYKAIDPSLNIQPGVTVGWQTDWVEITNFTDIELRANTNLEVGAFDTIHDCRSTVCTKNELYKVACVDPNCNELKNYLPYLKRAVLLAGARAKNDDAQPEKAETIIRTLSDLCSC
ncbi:MAG: hypothetical protein ACK53T_02355 [Planctomycetota bacterium]|jgi:hypothetical protein